MYSSITPRRSFAILGDCVRTFIPGSARVVQEAGVPRRPSISTRHRRQEPNASMLSVAHSFGTWNAGFDGGAHHRRSPRHGDRLAVDFERDERFGDPRGSAVIGFLY